MRYVLWASLLAIATAGCSPAPQDAPDATGPDPVDVAVAAGPEPAMSDESTLAAYHWRLEDAVDADGRRIEALFVRSAQPVQLGFSDGRLGLRNTCNHMGAEYTREGSTLQVGRFASTLMACPDEALMALDREIGRRLEGVLRFSVAFHDDEPELVLTDAEDGTLTFLGHPTVETRFGSSPELIFLEVAAYTRPCSHPLIPDTQCLQVREVVYEDGLRIPAQDDFAHFYESIEGHVHEPGVRQVLRVKRFVRDPAPADGSGPVHVLDMVVESELVGE